ncbi:hypothetical protein AAVH_24847 [Aphelenchoides avenae]|nr:hypothetical protein AAVH_24847 [Aphelenchus avenae]
MPSTREILKPVEHEFLGYAHGAKAHETVFLLLPVQAQPSAAVKQARSRTAVPYAPHVSVQFSRGPQSDQIPPVGQHLATGGEVQVPSDGATY